MIRLLTALLLTLSLGACRGCAGPEEPTEKLVRSLSNPYPKVDRIEGQMQKARAVLDAVGPPLGYGTRPGDILEQASESGWAMRLSLFLSRGSAHQLGLGYIDLTDGLTFSLAPSNEMKFLVRQSQARILDLQHAQTDEATMQSAYLAEIAWLIVQMDEYQKTHGVKLSP